MFAVQLPIVVTGAPRLRFALDTASGHVRTVVRNFGPVFVSRGVVQLSGYVDTLIASLLPTGAVAAPPLRTAERGVLARFVFVGAWGGGADRPAWGGEWGPPPRPPEAGRARLD